MIKEDDNGEMKDKRQERRETRERLTEGKGYKNAQTPWRAVEVMGKMPMPRSHHTAEVFNKRLYIMGGQDDALSARQTLGDIFMFNAAAREWRQLAPQNAHLAPPPISGHRSVLVGSKIYFFCGKTAEGCTGSVVALDLLNMLWEDVPVLGSYRIRPRSFHSASLLPPSPSSSSSSPSVVVFGGSSDSDFFADLHTFDLGLISLSSDLLFFLYLTCY